MMKMDDENYVEWLLWSDADDLSATTMTQPHPLAPSSHPQHWIVLSTVCVENIDKPNNDTNDHLDEEWKYVVQNHPIYCDFLMDDHNNRHNDNDDFDEEEDHPRSSTFLDSMKLFPNQRLHPCGRDNLLSRTTSPTTAISIANCHYKLNKQQFLGRLDRFHEDDNGNIHLDPYHFLPQNQPTNSTATTTTNTDWHLPLFPTPEFFAATVLLQPQPQPDALLTTNTILLQLDTTHAKQVLDQAWRNMKYNPQHHHSQQSNQHDELIGRYDAMRLNNITTTTSPPTTLDRTDTHHNESRPVETFLPSSFPVCARQTPSRQPPPHTPRQQQNSRDEIFLRTMETMLQREMQDMNTGLIVLACLAMLLTAALGWTARQILYPSVSSGRNKASCGGGTSPMKEIPSTIVKLQKHPTNENTVSPLSMDPVLIPTQTTAIHRDASTSLNSSSRSPPKPNHSAMETSHPVAVTPCTKLEEQWWNNRAIRRQAIRKKSILQPPLVPIPIDNHHHHHQASSPGVNKAPENHNSDDEDIRPTFILRTTTTVTPPPTTHRRTPPTTPPTGPHTPSSSFLQELQAAKAIVQPPPQSSWMTTTTAASVSSQPPSFVEDYW
jgi:hypothetical protein